MHRRSQAPRQALRSRPGNNHLPVLEGATHADFSGNAGGFRRQGPDSHVRAAVIETSIAFWRWALPGDRTVTAALDDSKTAASAMKRTASVPHRPKCVYANRSSRITKARTRP